MAREQPRGGCATGEAKHALADGRATVNGRGKLGRGQGKGKSTGKSTVRSRGKRAAKSGVLPMAKADRQECGVLLELELEGELDGAGAIWYRGLKPPALPPVP